MTDLVKRLRIKAGMIEMGEMIAWGSDSALMREAADALEMAAPAVQVEPVGYVRPHQLEALRSGKACGITMKDKPAAHNRVTMPLYAAPQPAEQQPDVTQLVEALEQIERWDGFPSTGEVWEDSGKPVSYGAAFGSIGERDFMREVARKALAVYRKGGE